MHASGADTTVASYPFRATREEEKQAWRDAALEQLKRLANNIDDIRRGVVDQGVLFQGGYGLLFAHRAERLADLQLRYSKFLDP